MVVRVDEVVLAGTVVVLGPMKAPPALGILAKPMQHVLVKPQLEPVRINQRQSEKQDLKKKIPGIHRLQPISVSEKVASVPARVLLQIILVILLCRIKRPRGNNLGHYRAFPLPRLFHLGLDPISRLTLRGAVEKNR